MQMTYQQAGLATTITYGEILTSSIQPAMYQDKAVIVITNQRYYDHFFEKIQASLLKRRSIGTFVATNCMPILWMNGWDY